MIAAIDWQKVERWFTGKALETLRSYVIPTLTEAASLGYWPKGASRKVWAALNKQAPAAKFAKANDRDRNLREEDPEGLLDDVCDSRPLWFQAKKSGSSLVHAMMFGQVAQAPGCVELAKALVPHARTASEKKALATAAEWAEAFAPVAALLTLLDATRPAPTVVFGSLSKTVAQNLGKAMGIALDSIESPKIEWKWIVYTDDKGAERRVAMGTILWPKGTKHNQSRFAYGSRAGNRQCHACGHAIHDPYNWVPLLGHAQLPEIDKGDFPVSLWVGRDCARRLFNVEVTGDAQYEEPIGMEDQS